MKTNLFDDLRPYYDVEIKAAMNRITDDLLFNHVANYLFPGVQIETLKNKFRSFNSIYDFQVNVMHHAIHYIMKNTMNSFSYAGFDQLEKNKTYLFVSNHRDILLDSALLQVILHESGFDTSEITFGSNLMHPDFVVDIGKSNKMFKVERGGSPRDFYANSKHLSDYIRYTLLQKKQSIWIAQRNGRTKNGNDATDLGILKMFSMSGGNDLLENFAELSIVPLSISYQYDPCDFMKTRELLISQREKYKKSQNEDIQSILTGINQYKGNVHIEFTKPITSEVLLQFSDMNNKDICIGLASLIDKQIHNGYRLYNTNYIAYDILNTSSEFLNEKYSQEDVDKFNQYMTEGLGKLEYNLDSLKPFFLEIYGNPVKNQIISANKN